MQKILTSHLFLAVEHASKVAIFWALSIFSAEMLSLLANDKSVAEIVTHYPWTIAVVMLLNMGFAALKKYSDLKKAQ